MLRWSDFGSTPRASFDEHNPSQQAAENLRERWLDSRIGPVLASLICKSFRDRSSSLNSSRPFGHSGLESDDVFRRSTSFEDHPRRAPGVRGFFDGVSDGRSRGMPGAIPLGTRQYREAPSRFPRSARRKRCLGDCLGSSAERAAVAAALSRCLLLRPPVRADFALAAEFLRVPTRVGASAFRGAAPA